MAQAFNPVGSLSGMAVASFVILPNLLSDARDEAGNLVFSSLSVAEKAAIRTHDLAVIRDPYVAIGIVVLVMFIIIALAKMPRPVRNEDEGSDVRSTLSHLWHNHAYRYGVVAQMFYVGAQIMVWTFIIQYAGNLGINKATAQVYNIVAMLLFLSFRFVGTYLMKYIRPARLMQIFGIGAVVCTALAILIEGMVGLYFLVAISAFMSIMFPSIYGIALEKVDKTDTSLGAAFLVMAIVGGALMPPLQGMIIDCDRIFDFPAVNISFVLPLVCFIVVAFYGAYSRKRNTVEI